MCDHCTPATETPATETPATETPATETPATETCPTCEHCSDFCTCCYCRVCQEWRNEALCSNCNRCFDCCGCYVCPNCDARGACSPCDNCEHCSDCCECYVCPCCDERYSDSLCADCDRCSNCCNCARELPLPSSPVFHVGEPGNTYPSLRYTSAEIECHGVERAEIRAYCKSIGAGIVDDGSLGYGGSEICTPPASGTAAETILRKLCIEMIASGATVNEKCGCHVHIDARDFTWADLRRLIALWRTLEGPHYLTQPHSRRKSQYARPCAEQYWAGISEHTSPDKAVKNAVYGDPDASDKAATKWGDQRYNCLNIGSWFFRGTVEIRTHSGTTSSEKILHWQAYWASVLDWVKTHTDEDVTALCDDADPMSVFLGLAPTPACREHLIERIKKFSEED